MPTSRATRVTSDANEPSWSTIVLTVFAVRRNSPRRGRPATSSAIVCDRSPLATAPITRAVSLVGCTRSLTSSLTDATVSAHAPLTSPIEARSAILPSLPTIRLRRSISFAILSLSSITSLKVSAIFPFTPSHSIGSRTEKSPFLRAVSATRSSLASSGGEPRSTSDGAWIPAPLNLGGDAGRDPRGGADAPLAAPFLLPFAPDVRLPDLDNTLARSSM